MPGVKTCALPIYSDAIARGVIDLLAESRPSQGSRRRLHIIDYKYVAVLPVSPPDAYVRQMQLYADALRCLPDDAGAPVAVRATLLFVSRAPEPVWHRCFDIPVV